MKIWLVVTEEEWEFGRGSEAGVDYHLETISAHSTEEAAIKAAQLAEEFQRVKVTAIQVDGGARWVRGVPSFVKNLLTFTGR